MAALPLCPRCGRDKPGKQCAGHECPLKRDKAKP